MPEQRAEMKSRGRRMDDDDGRIRGSEAGWEGVVQGGRLGDWKKGQHTMLLSFCCG